MSAKLSNGLNPKQSEFAALVASGMTQRDAAKAVGYNETWASELMQTPKVLAAIEAIQLRGADARIKNAEIDPAWVFEGIIRIREEGLKMVPTVIKGGEVVEKPVDLGAAARATEMAARLLGMMVERQSIELSGETRRVLEQMVQIVASEVDDPAVRERIIARLSGDGVVAAKH